MSISISMSISMSRSSFVFVTRTVEVVAGLDDEMDGCLGCGDERSKEEDVLRRLLV